jgi:hypothetical protein
MSACLHFGVHILATVFSVSLFLRVSFFTGGRAATFSLVMLCSDFLAVLLKSIGTQCKTPFE